jgi:hypothetical protein
LKWKYFFFQNRESHKMRKYDKSDAKGDIISDQTK